MPELLAFFQNVEAIRTHVRQRLYLSRRPENLQFVHLFMIAKTKVDPQIALGKIAASAPDLVLLDKIACRGA